MNALLAAATVFAQLATAQVAVTAPDPINVDPNAARALSAVCATAWTDASGQPAIAPTEEALAAMPAGERVELRVIGLDSAKQRRMIVNAAKKTADGRVEHQVTIEATGLEDAPTVCARLAEALVHHQTIEATQGRTTVTIAESTRKTRRVSNLNKSFGVKTGFTGAFSSSGDISPMGSLAFDVRLGGDRWFAVLGAGFLIPAQMFSATATSYGGIGFDLGANYYLTDTDFAPYVGGGVMPRLVFSGSVFNLAPYLQVGATISRKSGVHLNVDARVAQNVLPTNTNFSTGAGVFPTEVSVNLGVGF